MRSLASSPFLDIVAAMLLFRLAGFLPSTCASGFFAEPIDASVRCTLNLSSFGGDFIPPNVFIALTEF